MYVVIFLLCASRSVALNQVWLFCETVKHLEVDLDSKSYAKKSILLQLKRPSEQIYGQVVTVWT